MIRRPELKVDAGVGTEAMALPEDVVLASRKEQVETMAKSLTAVGVPYAEAVGSFGANMPAGEAIAFAREFAKDSVEHMRILYYVQGYFEDKAAFAEECLKAGFSPVGVALGGMTHDDDDVRTAQIEEAKCLIRAFGVDSFLAGQVTEYGELLMTPDLVDCVKVPTILPCELVMLNPDNVKPNQASVDWLIAVEKLRFDGWYVGLVFPNLVLVKEELEASDTENLSFPALVGVGGLHVADASAFEAPLLERVTGFFWAQRSVGLTLPLLREVGLGFSAMDTKGLNLPELERVGWEVCVDHAQFAKLPKLEVIGKGLKGKGFGGENSILGDGDFYAPRLKSVNGEPYVKGGP